MRTFKADAFQSVDIQVYKYKYTVCVLIVLEVLMAVVQIIQL